MTTNDIFSPEACQARLEAWRARQPAQQSCLHPELYQQKVEVNRILAQYGNQKLSQLTGINDRSLRKYGQFTDDSPIPRRFWDAVYKLGEK